MVDANTAGKLAEDADSSEKCEYWSVAVHIIWLKKIFT